MTPAFLVYVLPKTGASRFSLPVSEHAQRKGWPEQAGCSGVHRLTCMLRVCNLPYLCSGLSNRILASTPQSNSFHANRALSLLQGLSSWLPCILYILYIKKPFPVAMHLSNTGTSEIKTKARHFVSFLEEGDPS